MSFPSCWGIPTATDIALAWLVARAVFGKGHPAVAFLLLLAVAESEVESGLEGDLARARRLARLLGEDPDTIAALSRTLVEVPPCLETVPHVRVHLAQWPVMRAQLLLGTIELAGSLGAARAILGVRRLRWEGRRARCRLQRAGAV